MRIYAQNMFPMNRANSQKTLNQLLPGAARSADAQKSIEQREIREKAAALTRGGGRRQVIPGLRTQARQRCLCFSLIKRTYLQKRRRR